MIGNLTWDANGTLKQLGITDPFNATNQQTCNYGYDDLTRISSANCGSVWSQTFGFDVFGNLTKSGSVSFQPTYNPSTNRMSLLPGFTPTYDANGNTTADSLHTYAWDAEGSSVTVDSIGLTYDARGRMVEQNRRRVAQITEGAPDKRSLSGIGMSGSAAAFYALAGVNRGAG